MPYGFHSPQLLLIHLGTTMTKLWTGTWHWCLLLVFTAALSTTQGLLQGDVLLASFNASSYQVGASPSCGPEDAVISSDCLPDSPSWCAATANASEYLEASLVPLLEASAGKGVGEIVLVHAGSSLSNIKTVNVPGVQRCAVEAANKPNRRADCPSCSADNVFKVWVPTAGKVSVQRLDTTTGWQMELQFDCQGPINTTTPAATGALPRWSLVTSSSAP